MPARKTTEINKLILFVILLLSSGCLLNVLAGDLVINEFLASNASINQDPDFHDYADWIELFNAGAQAVELSGYSLTDDLAEPQKWTVPPGVQIPAKGFLLIWADGKNVTQAGYHTNFKLKKSGEEIALFSPAGVLIDSITFQDQTTDISFGRQPDGGLNWIFLNEPSPGASNISGQFRKAAPPQFSLPGGFYTNEQTLSLNVDEPTAVIHFTLDGSEPTESSPVYSEPILITGRSGDPNFFSEIRTTLDPHAWLPDWVPPAGEVFKATIIRARVFQAEYQPGDIISNSYFVDENIEQRYPALPVISIISDNKHLFDETTGIYVPGTTHRPGDEGSGNYFQDWERPAHIEFFEPGGQLGFGQDVGMKIQGGTSPASPLKGLHIIARSEYGSNRIDYPVFKDSRSKAGKLTEFKRFIIRGWGSTINSALFNDAFAHRLLETTDLDIQAYRPAVIFINGEYWGLQELREANKNSWYYQFHYGIDRDNPGFDLLEHTSRSGRPYAAIDEGDREHWSAMVNYLDTHDMSVPENYEYIKTQMDVENFMAYIGHCVYVGKWDWPNNNEASWRPRLPEGKWRWIQYDMETGFGVATSLGPAFSGLGPQFNMIKNVIEGLAIPGFGQYGPHPILVKLLVNDEFKAGFIAWFDEHLDMEFSADSMHRKLDEMVVEIEPYLQEFQHRWPFETAMNNDWYFHLNLIKNYIKNRPAFVRLHLVEQFGEDAGVPTRRNSLQPAAYELKQNFPNPFNSGTKLRYRLPRAGHVALKIYNISGQEVVILADISQEVGYHAVIWADVEQPSGVYYAVLQTGAEKLVRKMLLLK